MTPPVPPSALAFAKRRALRRRASAGGTMFVVAMTLAVLSTLGAWALQSAALEVRMAGYERQSTQTHYLAEYGIMAATQDVTSTTLPGIFGYALKGAPSGSGVAQAACLALPCVNFATTPPSMSTASGCASLNAVQPLSMGCWRWEMSSFGPQMPVATTANLLDPADGGANGLAGSLGATMTQGNISAEMSDYTQVAGHNFSGNFCTYWATVTSYGQTMTTGTTSTQGQGSELLRARFKVGPIQSGCQ